jgi:hypothetical protein
MLIGVSQFWSESIGKASFQDILPAATPTKPLSILETLDLFVLRNSLLFINSSTVLFIISCSISS